MIKRTIFSLRALLSLLATLCLASVMLIGIMPVYGASIASSIPPSNQGVKHVTVVVNFQGPGLLGSAQSAALVTSSKAGDQIEDHCVNATTVTAATPQRITASLRGLGVLFKIHFYSTPNCPITTKPSQARNFTTAVGGTVTCIAANCTLAEFNPANLVTVFFNSKGFADKSSARLFIGGQPYGSCITSSTEVTGPSTTTFEVHYFAQNNCTGTVTVQGPLQVASGKIITCMNAKNCRNYSGTL